jgi:hypothetical protein
VWHVGRERPQPARRVTGQRLDLDDLGAEVGQQLRRVGRRDQLAQLDDLQALDGLRVEG